MAKPGAPNAVDIRSIELITYNGTIIPLRFIAQEFVIFHDMYQQGVYCEVAILDSKGIIEMAPIVGDELLVVRFKTPNTEKLLQYVFRVYKIENRREISGRSEAFVLCACSQELINNGRKSVNKSYIDMTGDNIIKAIYASYLEPKEEFGIVRKKNLYLQETVENKSFVFPGVSPLKAINQVSIETQSKSRGTIKKYAYEKYSKPQEEIEFEETSLASNFIFYESYDGWYLHTLDYLLNKEKVEDFFLMDASLDGQDKIKSKIKSHQIIMEIKKIRQFDNLERLNTGMFFHKIESIDPITKRFKTDTFTYSKDAKYISHTEKNKSLFSKKSIYSEDIDTSASLYMISNIGEDYSNQDFLVKAKGTDSQIRNPKKLHEWFKYNHASRLQLNNIVLEVTIPGNTDIEIGNIINLHIPQNTENELYLNKENLLFGNRFFVTAIRHNINSADDNFFTVLECVKDVYAKDIIGEEVKLTTDNMEPEE
jgi:hypothetical protein